jgi:hypothetical protein
MSVRELSVAEAQSRRTCDVVVHEKAVRQSAIEFRPHEAGVNIPLWCKLPVDNTGDRVQRTSALRVLFAVAELDPVGRAKVGMLLVMVISGDHIHLVGNGVFDAGPINREMCGPLRSHAAYAAAKRERCSSMTNSAQEPLDPSCIWPTPQLKRE